jgi:hypothetical protein
MVPRTAIDFTQFSHNVPQSGTFLGQALAPLRQMAQRAAPLLARSGSKVAYGALEGIAQNKAAERLSSFDLSTRQDVDYHAGTNMTFDQVSDIHSNLMSR